jgi:HPt (histidine-containing phosphotransfer) domain-containing protein
MDDYLAKPVALKELAKKLDRWLPLVQAAAPLDREALSAICGGDAAAERDILAEFRRANDADAANFKLALAARDAQQITLASHRIRGASRAIGAIALAAVCERLERAGRAGDWQAIEADIGAFQLERERLNSYCEEAGCASTS